VVRFSIVSQNPLSRWMGKGRGGGLGAICD
jgi:hypothetical protein